MSKANPILRAFRRRMERLELAHLRQHCAELAQQLEDTQARLALAEQERAFAESYGSMHEREAEVLRYLYADTDFSTHRAAGLTRDGELIVVSHAH